MLTCCRAFLRHLSDFKAPVKSENEEHSISGLMKAILQHAKKTVHFNDDLERHPGGSDVCVKLKAIDEDNVDFYTPVMKNEDGFAIEIDKEFGDKVGSADEVQDNWKSANILPLLLEHHLRFAGWHRGVPCLDKSLPSNWTPRETARCLLQLSHTIPAQRLRVETMTEEEYVEREVVHWAPDPKGEVRSYVLPEDQVLTIGGSYTIPHFDLTTQSENEVLMMEESYTAPSTPRFDLMPQSEDEAPKIGALHTMPHFNLKPQNRRSISREGGCSASPAVAITQFNLMPQSGNSMSTAILPIDPLLQNGDNILAKPRGGTMDRSPRMASIPPIKVINPTPQSSPIKGQSGLREKNNGVSYLTVKNEHDSRSRSESPSSTASTNGEPITYDHLLRCAQNGVWRAAIKAATILCSEALESQDVELLVKVDVIAEQIKSKQSPLDEPDVSLHWQLINDAGEELLLNKGADVGKVARSVAQLLDEAEASEERDGVMDKWIARLPRRAP
ncbi:uncharacterized protein EI90DRAFT_3119682 [Cantharellus anzutake]|uniref:uncharacterized protein n=1 Tax=Cantharellus anzutake TaxID=1750568 RepID=UPI0019037EFE|nr:uncharacterized protein EI90DRAFT_3119682 [Cantharellus anzutake]KAF8336400.1 hypothetical protein EI90DRAFT_3119682 [Cantharellus anzutake]